MKITYLFPIAAALLIVLFYLGLPDLKTIPLPGDGGKDLSRRDALPLTLITLVYALVAFWNLGDTQAPQTVRSLDNESALIELDGETPIARMLIYTGIWKEAGWGAIIYVATIAAIDASLFEAALIDGANRWQKIRYIIWPELLPVVVTMMIVRVGYLMDGGFDQVFNLYSSAVYSTSDILDTYVYRMTFQSNAGFGVSAAIGMFKGVTNCVLLLTANFIAHLAGQKGIS